MPGAPSPWVDAWAPPQFTFGSTGAAGPVTSPAMNYSSSTSQTYDATLTYKLAGTIILALVTVFVLQSMGFRFVGAASVGFGGR